MGGFPETPGATCAANNKDVARQKPASMFNSHNNNAEPASRGVDDDWNTNFHTALAPTWWEVDLEQTYMVDYIEIHGSTEIPIHITRLEDFNV